MHPLHLPALRPMENHYLVVYMLGTLVRRSRVLSLSGEVARNWCTHQFLGVCYSYWFCICILHNSLEVHFRTWCLMSHSQHLSWCYWEQIVAIIAYQFPVKTEKMIWERIFTTRCCFMQLGASRGGGMAMKIDDITIWTKSCPF